MGWSSESSPAAFWWPYLVGFVVPNGGKGSSLAISLKTDLTTLDLYLSTERVIGQERARRQLAVMLKRQMEVAQGRWAKSECAVVGGFTGVGKSYMARMMCEACGLPFVDV